jgi:glycosyltransferase involved in cell wall biosynthesis
MKERILHVSCGGLGHGGVSAVIFSIVETLHDQFGFDCVVFKKHCEKEELFQKYGNLFRIEAYNDDGKRHLGELLLRPWRMYWGIYKICKTNKYKAIHCHNDLEEGLCLLAAKRAGVPIRIAHSHVTPPPTRKSLVTKIRAFINRKLMIYAATDLIGCSEAACSGFYGQVDFKVIYNSINLDKYSINHQESHDRLTFIHVGRYTYVKNQIMIINIFQKINQAIQNSQLLLVGFGEDKDKLEKEIHKLGLEDVVQLVPGNQVDVSKMYAVSDYMIFPSIYEGFGIVLIEAQAMGIPCFVSEAIQSEADAGLLTYIRLDAGVDVWAETILNHIKDGRAIDKDSLEKKMYQYSNEAIGKQYALIYKG